MNPLHAARLALTLTIALLCACSKQQAAPPAAPATEASLYERIAVKLAGRTDLATLGQPPAQMAQVQWMIGQWDIEATVIAPETIQESTDRGSGVIEPAMNGCWLQMRDNYPRGTQDLGFLTYNLVTKQWVSLSLDSTGNSVVTRGTQWEGDTLVLSAQEIEIVGEKLTLRQTLTRQSNDEFTVLNEEQLPSGKWIALDRYHYRRAKK